MVSLLYYQLLLPLSSARPALLRLFSSGSVSKCISGSARSAPAPPVAAAKAEKRTTVAVCLWYKLGQSCKLSALNNKGNHDPLAYIILSLLFIYGVSTDTNSALWQIDFLLRFQSQVGCLIYWIVDFHNLLSKFCDAIFIFSCIF